MNIQARRAAWMLNVTDGGYLGVYWDFKNIRRIPDIKIFWDIWNIQDLLDICDIGDIWGSEEGIFGIFWIFVYF